MAVALLLGRVYDAGRVALVDIRTKQEAYPNTHCSKEFIRLLFSVVSQNRNEQNSNYEDPAHYWAEFTMQSE